MPKQYDGNLRDHFLNKVIERGGDECWSWTGGHNSRRLPIYKIPKLLRTEETFKLIGSVETTGVTAQRVMYALHNGYTPFDKVVYHTCGNRRCMNPHHFKLGTKQDQSTHRLETNKQAVGKKHGKSKLTNQQVLEIKERIDDGDVPFTEIAKMYGVNGSTVCSIAHGHTWSHVTGYQKSHKWEKPHATEDRKQQAWYTANNKEKRFKNNSPHSR